MVKYSVYLNRLGFVMLLLMSVVGLIVVLFVVFLCSGFRSALGPLLCIITLFLITSVSL